MKGDSHNILSIPSKIGGFILSSYFILLIIQGQDKFWFNFSMGEGLSGLGKRESIGCRAPMKS